MIPLSTIYNCPFYWGEITLDETINILSQEPSHSYLLRKRNNGIITLALMFVEENLLEIEVSDCSCNGDDTSLPFGKFDTLEDFIENCRKGFKRKNGLPTTEKFLQPVMRKNTLSLKDIAKSCVRIHTNSYDQLEIPQRLKDDLNQEKLEQHSHFKMSLNEIEDKNSYPEGQKYRFTFPIVLNGQDNAWTMITVTKEDLIDEHDG